MTPRRSRARPILFLASADPGLRRRIRRSCSAAKWSWQEFADARELAEACCAHRPALVLLDLDLPRVRLAALREACGAAPILVLGSAARVERALAQGATDGIACPSRPKLVLHRMRRVLEHRASLEAVARMGGDRSHPLRPLRGEGRDSLTGLPHRERILENLAEALAAARPARESVTVLFVDLEIGRIPRLAADPAARDHAIVALSERMRESVRERDAISRLESRVQRPSVARIGGEEFCILLPGLARPQDAYKVAHRIQETLSRPLTIDGKRAVFSSSWGIAISPGDGEEAQVLLSAARDACRLAKQDGQERIRFFTAAVDAAAAERRALEAGLATVVERGELVVHYQPRVDLASNRICGFEALVRWRHPELGLVPPAKFIPIAEETGLIVPIGEHVLRTACAQNRAWQSQGLPLVRMSVNLSSVQFRDAVLPATVAGVLQETELDPEWLELELTESVLLDKAEATIVRLHRLRDMGLHLSIDDFGTGYSSLSYLKRFPIDALKIDRSFIREVSVDPGDAAITTSIVLLGKSLELSVVAEGVETRSQLSFLRVIQCHEAQGYLFSPPVSAAQAEALLTTGFSAELAA
ncbi:MAG: putative bifunctional diguanylate cyclase/phosphodiesterase [Planctomycetota bacterium]